MRPAAQGLIALVAANVIWGLSPAFYKLIDHVPPLEVLSHRTVWSLVLFGLYLALQGRLAEITRALRAPGEGWRICVAAAMVSVNWTLFIWAVQVDRVMEASLGYFIFPLLSVLLGVVFFGEALGRAKLAAVALAGTGVLVLTVGLGVPPYLSLILAATFGAYSVLTKNARTGPVVSVTAEVLLFTPFALVWLWGVHAHGWVALTETAVGAFGTSWRDSLILVLSGPMTAGPMMLFAFGARRLQLATVGLMQYLNPTLQFLLAVAIFAEPFTRWHGIAFPLIWLALAVYSLEALRQERAARRAAMASSTEAATEK
ncbi:RarD protein [Candidatus Rhodobacter oscarellae]|uniref:RarD protein n=1 Tax=Candidatus Rhodobacter oscarellae TaxID=1675527 RepID=A0A0J9E6L4_9RHOB|nr:EamA family transporter RarD [Candidatus Rhodobacter lobularis]KMW57464.1 RarD protein [Candidatus Rhodobacter lobularis]